MKEVVEVKLENEMDLILAHKRSMKMAELTGLSIILQTSLATAVSEIARCAIEFGKGAKLILGIDNISGKKYYTAIIQDQGDSPDRYTEACTYAKRIIDNIETLKNANDVQIILKQQLNFAGTFTDQKIDSFVEFFKREPPLSSYDEIRKKNLLLQDLADKITESEKDYRTLTDSLPILMFSITNGGVINYSNKWLQDFFGSAPKELSQLAWKNHIHPEDFAGFFQDVEFSLSGQLPLKGQYRFREKSTGAFVWHIFSIIPLKNERGTILRWTGFIVDINAQKLVEQTLKDNQELKEAQRQLQGKQAELEQKVSELNRSNYELEQFARLASHDLQEPLRKLFFYSDVLKTKYLAVIDSAGVKMLNKMTSAALRMRELINDLLSYSQLQHKTTLADKIDLNEMFKEIIQDFEITIVDKKAKFDIEVLPVIYGSTIKIRQLFRNIISNALKYSKSDKQPNIVVRSRNSEGSITITVTDNGIGFDERYKDRIFGLFERLHTKDKFPGTGIGLSVCKKIVEMHGGQISARSTINEYSSFDVTLPISDGNKTEMHHANS